MNQQSVIAKSLLDGNCLSIMTSFKDFGCTNLPRTLGRGIFKSSGVTIESKQIDFKNKYGISGYYFEYRLLYTLQNVEAIEKIKLYIKKEEGTYFNKPVKRGKKNIKPNAEPTLLQYLF